MEETSRTHTATHTGTHTHTWRKHPAHTQPHTQPYTHTHTTHAHRGAHALAHACRPDGWRGGLLLRFVFAVLLARESCERSGTYKCSFLKHCPFFVPMSVNQSSVRPSVPVRLSVRLYVCMSVCLPVCLFVRVCLSVKKAQTLSFPLSLDPCTSRGQFREVKYSNRQWVFFFC